MLTNTLENILLNVLFGRTAWAGKPSTLHFGLMTTPAGDAGTGGVEASGSGYARAALAVNTSNWTISGRTAINSAAITWPLALASWGNVSSVGIWTTATGGTLLAVIPLPAVAAVSQYFQFSIPIGELTISLEGALTPYACEALLKHWLHGTAMPVIPQMFATLGQGVTDTNLVNEPVHWGWQRVALSNNTSVWPAAANGEKKINLASPLQLPNSNGSVAMAPTTHFALFDSWRGQRITAIGSASANTITPNAGAGNLFQNGNRVVFVRQDQGTARIDTSTPTLYPNRVWFVTNRTATTYQVQCRPGAAVQVIHANGVTPLTQTSNAPTAFLADAANINVVVTNGDPVIATDGGGAHGLSVGDILVLAPRNFADYTAGNPPTYGGSTAYPAGLTSVSSPAGEQPLFYVVAVPSASGFSVSTTPGGTPLTPSGTGTDVAFCRLTPGNMLLAGQMADTITLLVGDSAQIIDEGITLNLE